MGGGTRRVVIVAEQRGSVTGQLRKILEPRGYDILPVRDFARTLGILRALRTPPVLLVVAMTGQSSCWDFLEAAMRASDLTPCPIAIVTDSDLVVEAHRRIGAPWSVLLLPIRADDVFELLGSQSGVHAAARVSRRLA